MNRQINFNVINEAFSIVKDRWQPFVLGGLFGVIAIGIIQFILSSIMVALGFIGGSRPASMLLLLPVILVMAVLMFAVVSLVQAGLVSMGLKAARGETLESGDVFYAFKNPVPFLVSGSIIGLGTVIGNYLCVLPGLVFAGLTMFTTSFMVDQKLAPMDAIKASIETLKSQWLMAAIFVLIAGLVSMIGSVACGIGVLFTLPIGFVAIVLCYRDLVLAPGATVASAPYSAQVTPPTQTEPVSQQPVPMVDVETPITEEPAPPIDDVTPEVTNPDDDNPTA